MRILSVNPTGLGPYTTAPTIPLDNLGIVWLHGKNLDKGGTSNASGKTWVFNAITFVLFGRVETFAEGGMTMTDDAINSIWNQGCCARVEFEGRDGHLYRVTYSRKWKGTPPYPKDSPFYPFHGTDVFLERYYTDGEDAGWEDERCAEMPRTRKRIVDLLGMTYERLLATTYFPQGKGFAFLKGSHATRMAILADAVGLSVWDESAATAKNCFDKLKEEVTLLEKNVAYNQGQLNAYKPINISDEAMLRAELESSEHDIAARRQLVNGLNHQVQTAMAKLSAIAAGSDPIIAALAAVDAEFTPQLNAIASQIAVYQAEWNALNKNPPHLPPMPVPVELEGAKAHLTHLTDKVASPACAECGSPINAAAFADQLAAARSAIVIADLMHQTRIRERTRDILHADGVHQARLDAIAAAWGLAVDEDTRIRAIYSTRRDELATTTVDSTTIQTDLTVHRASYNAAVAALDEAIRKQHICRGILQAGIEARTAAKELTAKIDTLLEKLHTTKLDLTEWAWLVKHFGNTGCKAWRLEAYVKRLNELIEDALASLDPTMRLTVVLSKLKANGDRTADLDLLVSDGDKTGVPIHLYSGAETSILAFAVLVSLYQLAIDIGRGTNILLLDEAVSAFDSHTAQIVSPFIESLRTEGRTIMVVSHAQCVDTLPFDAIITAVKKNGCSSVEFHHAKKTKG